MCAKRLNMDEYIGKKYSYLTIVEFIEKVHGKSKMLCRCDCGKETIVCLDAIKSGKTKSCGCWSRKRFGDMARTHGCRNERLYHVWKSIKQRCNNPNNTEYKNYGKRGIRVCEEWEHDYMSFRKWALENGYDEKAEFGKCTIERKNVNGNYEPSNCEWTDAYNQSRNTRTNLIIEYNGESHCLQDWANITGIRRETLSRRYRSGYRGEALFSKVNRITGESLNGIKEK